MNEREKKYNASKNFQSLKSKLKVNTLVAILLFPSLLLIIIATIAMYWTVTISQAQKSILQVSSHLISKLQFSTGGTRC